MKNDKLDLTEALNVCGEKINAVKKQNDEKERLVSLLHGICTNNKLVLKDAEYTPFIIQHDSKIDIFLDEEKCHGDADYRKHLLEIVEMFSEENSNIPDESLRQCGIDLFIHTLVSVILPELHKLNTKEKIKNTIVSYSIPSISYISINDTKIDLRLWNPVYGYNYAGQGIQNQQNGQFQTPIPSSYFPRF